MSEPFEKQSVLTQAVVRVGDGRGFVVEHRRQRFILTAAHCLPVDADGRLILPPATEASCTKDRTYEALLGPLRRKSTVWAECLFADPIADIAVLGVPDDQELFKQADAYQELVTSATPLAISDAPKQGCEIQAGRGTARVLSLDAKWIECSVTRIGTWLHVEEREIIKPGMSGSPIINMDRRAIGLISTGPRNPVLRDNLPAWFFRRKARSCKQR